MNCISLLKKLQCKIVGHKLIMLDWDRTAQGRIYYETICDRCLHFSSTETFIDFSTARFDESNV